MPNISPKISIITPCYNVSEFIADAMDSVLKQTYQEWEMIIIDDHSTDDSIAIVKRYEQLDSRIKLFQTDENSGSATIPRNVGIQNAQGDYIAFLDADDMWAPQKLEKQLRLAQAKNAALVFSNYEKINSLGKQDNRTILAPKVLSYKQLLKGNQIGCLTAMYSVDLLGKCYFKSTKHEDYVLWLSLLKKGYLAYNVSEVLAFYRVGRKSLSSNKLKALSWTWNIYRREEGLSIVKSVYLFIQYVFRATFKYLK